MTWSSRTRVAVATVAVASMAAAGCGWGDSSEAVVVETDPSPADPNALSPVAQRAVSGAASFAQADESSARVTPDGISLSIAAEYFEPIEIDGWTAPAHCSFAARATLDVQGQVLISDGFAGPTSTLDDVSGVLGAALEMNVPSGEVAASTTVPSTTVPSTTVPSTTEVPTTPGPPPSFRGTVPPPDAGQPALVFAVAVFGHDRVATLELVGVEDLESPWGTSDTQPLDGWTPLAVAVPADEITARGLPQVQLDLVDLDGSTDEEGLPIETAALEVLTDDWVFDFERVDRDCEPPEGDVGNEIEEPDEHIFGGPIAEKPTLPSSGPEQPADPAAATEAAMTAIRTVYDLSDALNEEAQRAKAPFVEDPDRLLAIIQDLIAAELPVEAYMDELVPVFDGLVFLSPTEAAVSYQVGPNYHWEIGRVLLIEGRWRVALGTVCRDLLDANFRCADIAVDPPPGPLG